MSFIRNFSNLIKITQNNATKLNYNHIKRNLRRLPTQKLDIQTLPTVVSTPNVEQRKFDASQSITDDPTENLSTALETPNSNKNYYALPLKNMDANENQTQSDTYNDTNDLEIAKATKDYVPTYNLAAYVNDSPLLQQLLQLGVDFHKIERRKGLAKFVLSLDFEQNIKPCLLFLKDHGVSDELFGEWLTKNPLIFKVDMDDLQTRINYLESKKFTTKQCARIISKNPFWLMFSTRRIDRRLGHFQKEFHLSGDDVRFLASKQPRLITYNMEHIRKATFCIKEEMGFDSDEMKCLLLNKPRIWMMKSDDIIERFAYAHNTMALSHDMILQFPEVLQTRDFRLRQRHEFLKLLGRVQYDPEKDLYVSPRDVVLGTDFEFVENVAKSDMQTYKLYLRTL